jgi:hypothetical protein
MIGLGSKEPIILIVVGISTQHKSEFLHSLRITDGMSCCVEKMWGCTKMDDVPLKIKESDLLVAVIDTTAFYFGMLDEFYLSCIHEGLVQSKCKMLVLFTNAIEFAVCPDYASIYSQKYILS